MKKWQKRLMAVVTLLGFGEKMAKGLLTADDQKKMYAEYEKTHGISFEADKAKNEDDEPEGGEGSEGGEGTQMHAKGGEVVLSAEKQQELAILLGVKPEEAPKTEKEATVALTNEIKEIKLQVEVLSKESDKPKTPEVSMAQNNQRVMGVVLGHAAHSATHLFGIENEFFLKDKWYNKLMTGRSVIEAGEADEKLLLKDLTAFGKQMKARFKELEQSNQLASLDYNKMLSGGGSVDYSTLTDVAGEYIIRRTDLIFAFFRSLPSVTAIFPVVSNVQNKEIASSASFGELSQAYRKGRIFKGSVKFAAEIYSVIDVMFKFQFEDMIDLEKKYIGYINKEASGIIKWTFIEWLIVNFGKQLINEQNVRRVEGVRVTPQSVTSNPALFSADGVIRAIQRVEEELKVLPFEDLVLYSNTTMLAYVESFWAKVVGLLPSVEGYKVHGNLKHKLWYQALYAEKYGEFSGVIVSGQQLTDLHPESIVWVPNMSNNNYKMWITIPGIVETYEDKPGEMLAFEFTTEFEGVLAKSRWKEGAGLSMAGVKFATKAELIASERKYQYIFTNDPASALTLAGTVSFAANSLFAITGVTQVDTVTGYAQDKVYKLVATAAADEVKKLGAFAKIASKFTAGAAGDYIKVYAELEDVEETIDGETVTVTQPTGLFLELERKVTA